MKKSIIAAGAASVALAAMPIVGAFAAPLGVGTQTDTLKITIGSACAFGYNSGDADPSGTPPATIDVPDPSHNPGKGTWGASGTTADTLSVTMINGTSSNDLGSTVLSIYCNNAAGYNITTNGDGTTTTTVGALNGATSGENIPLDGSFSTSTTGWSYKVAAGTGAGQRGIVKNSHGTWATSSNKEGVIAGSDDATTPSVPQTTTNTGDEFTITYGAGINEALAADTYTGNITYTLVQL